MDPCTKEFGLLWDQERVSLRGRGGFSGGFPVSLPVSVLFEAAASLTGVDFRVEAVRGFACG